MFFCCVTHSRVAQSERSVDSFGQPSVIPWHSRKLDSQPARETAVQRGEQIAQHVPGMHVCMCTKVDRRTL